jgi:hypothetical protein
MTTPRPPATRTESTCCHTEERGQGAKRKEDPVSVWHTVNRT